MSATEFAFLALGLVLGIAVGAALVVVFRARPAPRREVRLTVSPNAIAVRRASTLSFADSSAIVSPADGGPAANAGVADARAPTPVMAPDLVHAPARNTRIGTPVPEIAVRRAGSAANDTTQGRGAVPPARPSEVAPGRATAVASAPSMIAAAPGIVRHRGSTLTAELRSAEPRPAPRPSLFTLQARPALDTEAPLVRREIRLRPAGSLEARVQLAAGAVGIPIRPEAHGGGSVARGAGGADGAGSEAPEESGACAMERRMAAERCEVAGVARAHASAAADTLATARREYDMVRQRVDEQERLADPRELRAAKDAAHQTFREAQASAADADATEAAAREWLDAINRLNNVAVAAVASLEVDREELRRLVPTLERRSVEADAARITAGSAESGCRDARELHAACEELVTAAASAARPAWEPDPEPVPGWPTDAPSGSLGQAHDTGGSMDPEEATARILRIFAGDRPSREALVAALAGQDPEEHRRWRLVIADFVDAVVARSIEDSYLEVRDEHPFWATFDRTERRDIVTALAALGFRFDGMGGFADERVPGQRDLSLAVGYAGLDRMRVRNVPRESELARLFAGATVAADEWLVAQAGDLSLGRMIDALGSRSGELADAWNAWGRIRPLLLATDAD